ncbi:MAG: DUF4340 domain-containing protein [Parcubacteria group bacterium]|nr:DUF4340 domain-containing protein [Parcubacteria group bacterium]
MPVSFSKFKTVLVLLGFLGALLVVLGISQELRGSRNARVDATFFAVDADRIDKIRVVGVNGLYENVLERAGDRWVVSNRGSYRANEEYVTELLDIFATLPRGELASRNPETHEELQLDELGVALAAWQGAELVVDAVIGKEGPGFVTTYVRHAASDLVYLAPRNIRPAFNRTDWRDKRVWVFEPLKVTSIDWRYNDVEVSLIKTGDGWKQVTPFSKDSSDAVIGPVLAQLSDLFAADIKEDVTKEQAGISGKAQTIRIELGFETGEKDALIVGDKLPEPSEEYYIGRENSPLVWTVDSWTVENALKKEIGDF